LVNGNDDQKKDEVKIDSNLKTSTGTDADTLKREEEAINIDGLSQKEMNDLRKKVDICIIATKKNMFH
jgi:stress response protein YsnF